MKCSDIKVLNEKETRGGFGEGVYEAGKENPNVVVLTADLAGSMKIAPFIKDFPERFIQVGIAEANMIGIAAGLTQVHREVRPQHAQRTEFTADPTLQHGLAIPEVIWPLPRRHQGSIDDAGAQQGPGQQRPTTAGRLWHQGAGDAGVNDGQLKHG